MGTDRVYVENGNVWDARLNLSNVELNMNKFYQIQLLQDDKKENFSVLFSWGRVGKPALTNLIACGSDLDKAKETFCAKFDKKTNNYWADRDNFQRRPKKYDLIQIDHSARDETDRQPVAIPESKLHQKIQDFIKMICDTESMEDAVTKMQYDVRKCPLGNLTPAQIKSGYSALKNIQKLIETNDTGSELLKSACSDFYTRIPHDSGMQRPPLITTESQIYDKLQLLQALFDIEIAMAILHSPSTIIENPVDRQYRLLNCDLRLVREESKDYQMIKTYLENTHGPTHDSYKMKIMSILTGHKSPENFDDIGNKMLLWHGSRKTNWASIIGKGLRIAPPEAPHTGHMFGKGVYFADISSKSANYCKPSPENPIGVMLLCEVSLGNCNELLTADYYAHMLPDGKHSVKGLGKWAPNPKKHIKLKKGKKGTVVPQGQCIETGVENQNGRTLDYNEYVVYNTNQIRMRYLVTIQFQFV